MRSQGLRIGRLAGLAGLALWPATGHAAPTDYRFEPIASVVARGVAVQLQVRVWRLDNRLVPQVQFSNLQVDRSPEGQADGALPAFFAPSLDYGVYTFRADLPTDGTWALKFTAKIPGEAQPVAASVTFKVVGRLTPPQGAGAPTSSPTPLPNRR
ncbi:MULTISPECIES: hypothetical protein [Caulobacter]|jgi:hypothetical protein|nr:MULTISPECIES: hypothetical protein [Caulobacter]ATC24383.1 hypothetical protein CA608_07550 [Caulobacter vibrioides]MBQ1561726.1 hypothetical protein [Caulobacter sp.]